MTKVKFATFVVGFLFFLTASLFGSGLVPTLHAPIKSLPGDVTAQSSLMVGPAIALTADFSFPAPVSVGSPVTITAVVSGGASPYSFNWDNGAGTMATTNPVVFIYNSVGTYTVSLTVSDGAGGSVTVTHSLSASAGGKVLDFVTTSAYQGSPMAFSGTSIGPGGFLYQWDFGDGSPPIFPPTPLQTAHTYAAAGTYVVELRAVNSIGSISYQASRPVLVQATTVAVDFVWPSLVTNRSSVAFNATVLGGLPPFSFTWDTGSGSTLTGNPVSFTYNDPGTYIVVLTIKDALGKTVVAARPVVVEAFGKALDFYSTSAYVGSPVAFSGTSVGPGGYVYQWDFGDGGTGSSLQSSHIYSSGGTYFVLMKAVNAIGSTSGQASHTVILKTTPVTVDFSWPSLVTNRSSVALTARVSGGVSPYAYSWDNGDHSVSTVNPATFTYTNPGVYIVSLSVTDSAGHTAVASRPITVDAFGKAMDFSSTSAYVDSPAGFSGTSVGPGGYSYQWDFGDGTSTYLYNTDLQVSHTYSSDGTYIVLLKAINAIGSTSGQASHAISVLVTPVKADFSWITPVDPGTPITFQATASGGTSPYTFQWDSGGGTILASQGAFATFTYTDPGKHIVVLTVIDNVGAVTTAARPVEIMLPGKTADFSWTQPAVPGTPVMFTGTTAGPGGYDYQWNFGDGSPLAGNTLTPSHTYATSGIFIVQFQLVNIYGIQLAASHFVVVAAPNVPPTLTVVADKTNGFRGDTFTLTIASSDSDGSIVNTRVDWADGTIDNFNNAVTTNSHAYTTLGGFTVSVTVTDNGTPGLTASATLTITVNDKIPRASFTASPSSSPTGTPITFDGTSSYDPDGTIASYSWDLGDSTHLTGASILHSYGTSGSYTVTLTVTDNDGSTNAKTASYVVTDRPPQATFTFSPTSPMTQVSVGFDGSTSVDPDGTIVSYAWSFGDSSTGSGSIVTHVYSSTGSFTVTLTVMDNNGSIGSYILKVTVSPSHGQVKCGGDDTCSVESNSTITKADADRNRIQLTATGAKGTVGYANVTIPIRDVPNIGRLRVTIDGNRIPRSAITITMNATDYFVYFTFSFHSPVDINLEYNPSPDAILGLDPTTFYGGLAGIGVAVLAAGIYMVRRRRTSRIAP